MNNILSIVEYNTSDLLQECLKSIFKEKSHTLSKVYVVDNASVDDSVRMVKREFPQVEVIETGKNLGFGAGHNIVLRQKGADYISILNSDAEVSGKVLDKMVEFMEENKNCGVSSCKVLGFDHKLQPNGGDLPIGFALINWLFNLEIFGIQSPSFHRNDRKYYEKAHEVGWVSGNFMIIRREVLRKIRGFDESYFMYFEDVDLCFRVRKNGFSVMINPDVTIKHLSGGSLDNPRFSQWSGEFKGLIKFYNIQFGWLAGFLVRIGVYVGIILRIIAFAIKGKLSYSLNYAKVIKNI